MIYKNAKRRNVQNWTTEHFSIYAATFSRGRYGFAHECSIYPGTVDPAFTFEPVEGVRRWCNRTWESFTYESALRRAIEKLPATLRTLATREIIDARNRSEHERCERIAGAFEAAFKSMPDGCRQAMAGATVESMEDAERLTGVMNAIGIICNASNGGKA